MYKTFTKVHVQISCSILYQEEPWTIFRWTLQYKDNFETYLLKSIENIDLFSLIFFPKNLHFINKFFTLLHGYYSLS